MHVPAFMQIIGTQTLSKNIQQAHGKETFRQRTIFTAWFALFVKREKKEIIKKINGALNEQQTALFPRVL